MNRIFKEKQVVMKKYCHYLIGFLLVSSCTPFQPAFNDGAKTPNIVHNVKGRQGLLLNQKLSFGDFYTSKVKRSWTRGTSSRSPINTASVTNFFFPDLFSMEWTSKHQRFTFIGADATNQKAEVFGVSQFDSEDFIIGNNKNSIINILEDIKGLYSESENLFYLQIFVNEDQQPWQLVLDNQASQSHSTKYRGIFSLDENNYYTLIPITKMQGKNGPRSILAGSVGYEINNKKGNLVAAVLLMDKGKVYLNTTDATERFLMENLCAALLLQENINND